MKTIRYDFNYTMENIWGDEVQIYGNDDGPAWVSSPDHFGGQPHEFRDEAAAYNWAYKRGYRD